ncbi:MAG: VacJ family lipoprotein [Nitrospiraceae bacterium]|nr:MAG: VacJ family lipoprotein [Nitrospiraceae bacterium]
MSISSYIAIILSVILSFSCFSYGENKISLQEVVLIDDGGDMSQSVEKEEVQLPAYEIEEDEIYPVTEENGLDRIADPLEPVNRIVFHFNDKLYFWLLKPVATGYAAVLPEEIRMSVQNFFNNISAPVRIVNNLLQFKIKGAGNELLRFGINSTMGMLGLYDVARNELGMGINDEDFGQTLGVWGAGPGFFINWPFLGPSSLRDSVGYAGDYFLEPLNYLNPAVSRLAVKAGDGVNSASLSIGDYEGIKKDAIDPYSAFRDIYYQYRKSKIDR